jgi:hypothetical protein
MTRRGKIAAAAMVVVALGAAASGAVLAAGRHAGTHKLSFELPSPKELAKWKRIRAQRAKFVLGVPRKRLDKIAECESHGNPRSIGGGGLYRGKYQFDRSTWHSNGGVGDPAKAPEGAQDRMAAMVLRRRGSSPWPNCA